MLAAGHLLLPPARSESMMSRSKSRPVVLSPAEREMLRRLVRTGSHPAQQVRRARILLELDENDPARWSLRLLEKHVVLIDDIPDLDHSTIGRVLKRGRFVLI
jgi:hypothetical protein